MTVQEACEVLGVRFEASFAETKAAYREQAKRYHPDLHGNGSDNRERFERVQAAYEALCRMQAPRRDAGRPNGRAHQ